MKSPVIIPMRAGLAVHEPPAIAVKVQVLKARSLLSRTVVGDKFLFGARIIDRICRETSPACETSKVLVMPERLSLAEQVLG